MKSPDRKDSTISSGKYSCLEIFNHILFLLQNVHASRTLPPSERWFFVSQKLQHPWLSCVRKRWHCHWCWCISKNLIGNKNNSHDSNMWRELGGYRINHHDFYFSFLNRFKILYALGIGSVYPLLLPIHLSEIPDFHWHLNRCKIRISSKPWLTLEWCKPWCKYNRGWCSYKQRHQA